MKSWFEVKALADTQDSPVEAFIYDEIGSWGISARDFIAAVRPYKDRAITLRINSPGGEVWDGLAIYNYLKGLNVTTRVDGIAASMASIIALAGKTVQIASNGFFMVHNPAGIVMGEADDMEMYAEMLKKVRSALVGTYQRETGAEQATVEKWMDDETWFTAAEAKAAGLADEIADEVSFSASLTKFAKAPAALRPVDSPANDVATNIVSTPERTLVESLKALLGIGQPEPAKTEPAAPVETPEAIQAKADLATARQTIGTLEAKIVSLEAEVKAANEKAATAKIEADKQASIKAAEITAGQGQPPIKTEVTDTPATTKANTTELFGLARAIAAHTAQK